VLLLRPDRQQPAGLAVVQPGTAASTEAIMTKLTDTQLIVLSSAAQQDGKALPLPESLKAGKAAAASVLKALLKRKLLEEIEAGPDDVLWRAGKDGQRYALVLTPAGWAAIGVEPPQAVEAEIQKVDGDRQKPSPKAGTALGKLISLLSRKSGASIQEAIKATGWQAHSIRGAISGALKKKHGLTIASEATDSRGRVYRIVR